MIKTPRTTIVVAVTLLLMPMWAFAQDADSSTSGHKLADLLWGIGPFIVLGILFWFFFIRQIRKQQTSPLAKRQMAYLDSHEQHMKRMEQLVERIAVALEKDRP